MNSLPLTQTHARRLRALRNRRHRGESGLFLAEGIRVVEDLLASPVVTQSVVISPSLEDTSRGRQLLERLPPAVAVYATTEAGLQQLAETETPQGIVAVGEVPPARLPGVLPEGAMVVVLDRVQDPGNVGTLVRCADAFGVAAVVGLVGTVDFWNGKTVRSAAGSCFRVPLVRCAVPELVRWAGSAGVTLWGAAGGGSDVACLERPARLGLVLGNEGEGLGEAVRAVVGGMVGIPIRGAAESLNVAMAGTILMYLLSGAKR